MFCFLALPKLGINLSSVQAAVIGLALIASAYEYEVLRGAFLAIPQGQSEAANALGLSRWSTYRHVVMPQVLRIAIPPLLTFACTSLKRTSVASAVAVVDIMGMAKRLRRQCRYQSARLRPVCDPRLFPLVRIRTTAHGSHQFQHQGRIRHRLHAVCRRWRARHRKRR
jgi:ABC-type amino acid transport system permease subunit